MTAHGDHVRSLEAELERRRANEKDLQLAVAKLRAEKCRLEAEVTGAQHRQRQAGAAAEALDQRHTATDTQAAKDFRARLMEKDEAVAALQREVEALQRALHESTAKQDRILQEQESTHSLAERVAAMEKELHRIEVHRNRVVTWKRDRLEARASALRTREVLLAWRATAVRSRRARLAARDTQLTQRERIWSQHDRDVSSKLAKTHATLGSARGWLLQQRQELLAWSDLFVLAFSTQVTERIKQHEHALRIQMEQQQSAHVLKMEQLRHEFDAQLALSKDAADATRTKYKRRVAALCACVDLQRQRALRAQAFLVMTR
ncbi:hypothetical protein ATCC90586_010666 [Pythium insidiosum]|nr:hypothetical protein ATCC90586_010666 [Pythium insidiosum]